MFYETNYLNLKLFWDFWLGIDFYRECDIIRCSAKVLLSIHNLTEGVMKAILCFRSFLIRETTDWQKRIKGILDVFNTRPWEYYRVINTPALLPVGSIIEPETCDDGTIFFLKIVQVEFDLSEEVIFLQVEPVEETAESGVGAIAQYFHSSDSSWSCSCQSATALHEAMQLAKQ